MSYETHSYMSYECVKYASSHTLAFLWPTHICAQNIVSFIGLFCRISSLLQNIVSFIGLFCKRDLWHANISLTNTHLRASLTSLICTWLCLMQVLRMCASSHPLIFPCTYTYLRASLTSLRCHLMRANVYTCAEILASLMSLRCHLMRANVMSLNVSDLRCHFKCLT